MSSIKRTPVLKHVRVNSLTDGKTGFTKRHHPSDGGVLYFAHLFIFIADAILALGVMLAVPTMYDQMIVGRTV
tara:strand:+ start:1907 stop:2125 length:219 start_codon:yes stop_codon:yes gene_type:complete